MNTQVLYKYKCSCPPPELFFSVCSRPNINTKSVIFLTESPNVRDIFGCVESMFYTLNRGEEKSGETS